MAGVLFEDKMGTGVKREHHFAKCRKCRTVHEFIRRDERKPAPTIKFVKNDGRRVKTEKPAIPGSKSAILSQNAKASF